jgi:hypothetical protein
MKGAAVAGLLIVALLVGAGAGYLYGTTNERVVTSISTTTKTSIITSNVTTEYTVPTLELLVRVEPTQLSSGQNVTITDEVYNPLATEVVANSSEIINPTQGPCGRGVIPTGVQVYEGHYTFTNLTEGTPLMLYNASGGPHPCPAPYSNVFHFQPDSDKAIVFYLGTSIDWVTNETIGLKGYWVQVPSSGLPRFALHEFAAGEYTVLVFDAWGQQQLEYFVVTG